MNVITLEGSQRYVEFKKQTDLLNIFVNKIVGTRGSDLTYTQKLSLATNMCSIFCSNGIIGCADSHIRLWKSFLLSNYTYCIVFEDDTYITKGLIDNIDNILVQMGKIQCDFLYLYSDETIRSTSEDIKITPDFNMTSVISCLSLSAYVINKKCAKLLIDFFTRTKITYHIDLTINLHAKEIGIKRNIISPNGLTRNLGFVSSTMSNYKEKFILKFLKENYQREYYLSTFPVFSFFGKIDISIYIINLFLIFIILLFLKVKNFIIWGIFGVLLSDIFS